MNKVNPNNGNEKKSDILPWAYSNQTPYLFSIINYSSFSMTFKI